MQNHSRKIFTSLLVLIMMFTLITGAVLNVQAAGAEFTTEDMLDSANVIYTFTADDFRLPYGDSGMGDAVVDDAQSTVGKAAMFSYEKRAESGDAGLMNAIKMAIPVKIWGANTKNERNLGEISVAQIQAAANNDGYVLYVFEDFELIPYSDSYYLPILNCWGLQLPLDNDQVNALTGKTIDVYLSIKVTGDIKDVENNPPTYYIDRIIFAESAPGSQAHEHTFGEWICDDVTHSSTCSTCGLTDKSGHEWDTGVVTKEPTKSDEGEKLFTCSVCGTTSTQKIDKLTPAEEKPEDIKTPSNNQTPDNKGNNSNNNNMQLVIAIAMFAVAIVIIVVALVLNKRKKK